MKLGISMTILLLAVLGLCLWDTIHTTKIFATLEDKSNSIVEQLNSTDITNENLQNDIINLNDYWTEKMDTLCISISRKDLQPVSDYLQYLYTSILNENQEDAITYSRLLNYNIIGLKEITAFSWINLL